MQSPDIFLPDSIINSTNKLFLFIVQNYPQFTRMCDLKAQAFLKWTIQCYTDDINVLYLTGV